jgi:hypothetical protein
MMTEAQRHLLEEFNAREPNWQERLHADPASCKMDPTSDCQAGSAQSVSAVPRRTLADDGEVLA